MGIGKRIVDLAKANLNALLDKASGDGGVDELTDEELEAELRRRRERRQREADERRAAERAAEAAKQRIDARAAEGAKQRNEARAAEAAKAAQGRSARTTTTPPPRRDEKRRVPPTSAPIGDKRLRELYAQLEVPYGASFEDVKRSFRRLMRKYHPDLHAGNPAKQKTATQLTMSLTQAYNELEQHLTGGRRG